MMSVIQGNWVRWLGLERIELTSSLMGTVSSETVVSIIKGVINWCCIFLRVSYTTGVDSVG